MIVVLIANTQGDSNSDKDNKPKSLLRKLFRRETCSDPNRCLSKHGYCGIEEEYCGEGCQAGPCKHKTQSTNDSVESGKMNETNGNDRGFINDDSFRCVFNNLDDEKRRVRFRGLQESGYKPQNAEEAAVFLAHVYHETDGLKTLVEYCAPGKYSFTYKTQTGEIFLN